ncbi:MAG TPA: 4Fe-4S dicluster domain-containing protein, partial [Candidatus Nitrosotenuis sp.]|nr:4Fe-4S dicluster domain-containing protein [Candidatus Nitrosotenuis sp.]
MAEEVFNWQINRKMPYPYKDHRPDRQVAWVFDLNKCIGCQTCTLACKTTWTSGRGQECMFWNNVETKPYGFYPLAWDVKLMEILGPQTWKEGTYQGKTVFEASGDSERVAGFVPEEADWAHPNLGEDETAGRAARAMGFDLPHLIWMYYMPRICNHCTFPACLAACPRKAIYKRQEDGIVLIDQKRCRGYRECLRACPYKRIFYNLATKVSEKCIGCYPLLEQGEQTRCVSTCIGK